jgi:hypothetical protein
MWQLIVFAVSLLLASGAPAVAQDPGASGTAPQPPAPSPLVVRGLLNANTIDGSSAAQPRRNLVALGEAAFPIYEQILNDPAASPREVERIFNVVALVQADRRRFVDHAIRRLADPDMFVRMSALGLLGRIGSRADAVLIVPFLWEPQLNWMATDTLGRIGGEPDLVALEFWAQSAAEGLRHDENGRKRLQQNRDTIQKRVEEERKKAGGPPAVPRQPDPTVPSAQEVRKTLTELGDSGEVSKIVALGERVYPAFEAILSDPAVTTSEALRVFEQLAYMAGDRSRFAPYVVRRLAAYRPRLSSLIQLLGDIGSRRDTAPLVALLYDSNPIVVQDALEALGKLGGEREAAAIDIWLKAKAANLRAGEEARAAIRKRVEEEKKRKN